EKPLQHLQEALKLNADLWRGHYCIGRIYRDTGKAKEAADELTRDLQSAPTEPGPWVALAELSRQWDYPGPESTVTEAVTGDDEGAWYYREERHLLRGRHGVRRQAPGRQGDRCVHQGARVQARQPQGEVSARPGLLPQS